MEREAFERWAEKRELDISPNTTVFADELPYADIVTQDHWDCWQASRLATIDEAAALWHNPIIKDRILALKKGG